MRRLLIASLALAGLISPGCLSARRTAPKPGLTEVGSKPVTLPGHLIRNVLVVEDKWDKAGPYHFIVDTGSSVTLVSPELAERYGDPHTQPEDEPMVKVLSSEGKRRLLRPVTLERLQLGSAKFLWVPALVYDCSDLSAQFGVRIDGVLGFPLFRNAVLTLDYPNECIVLRSKIPEDGIPGETILFDNADKTPTIPVSLGDKAFAVLIDSGSSSVFSINPAGLAPRYKYGPVAGPTVSTLGGDSAPRVGRLADVLRISSFDVPQPIADETQELSSLGGGILSRFTVTFDQRHNEAFFQRDVAEPLVVPALRTTGLSFTKTQAYWKVVGVIPGSPAAAAAVADGDLVSRINGEPVSSWDPERYDHLLAGTDPVSYTFIDGSRSAVKPIKAVDLVP
jgi:hypothetical protein